MGGSKSGDDQRKGVKPRTGAKRRHPSPQVKGNWTKEDDALLISMVEELGLGKWSKIAHLKFPGRIGKQCRERWNNQLDPEVNREPWSEAEEHMLVEEHKRLGNKWADIAREIPRRTENHDPPIYLSELLAEENLAELDFLEGLQQPTPAYGFEELAVGAELEGATFAEVDVSDLFGDVDLNILQGLLAEDADANETAEQPSVAGMGAGTQPDCSIAAPVRRGGQPANP
ncbi:hypothetical protein WJX72_000625 [[Myrmecia] bisecta]|uniref:Uncharacterized protein n=1 Tax=[Myrmecia] bisecta TaxID=41462 RepID=A0AAW1QE22_9CHLO